MYNVSLYENGRFCTNIGDPVADKDDAIVRIVSRGHNLTPLKDYLGFSFDRAGTTCALVVTDQDNNPIKKEV